MPKVQTLPLLVFLLVLMVPGLGCDSGSAEEVSDAELMVGEWALTGLSDRTGDISGLIGTVFDTITASFTSAGAVVLRIKGSFQDEEALVRGTYTVAEGSNALRLSVIIIGLGDGERVSLDFQYAFSGSDRLTLDVEAATTALFTQIFGLALQAPLQLRMKRD